MCKVNDEYLEDEVRDGFYIPSIAKRAWAAELSILSEINRICEKYDIKYFADWGSFLGAVRHQGFIPWDDDLDICMFRSDLNRFIQVADTELTNGFQIHSFMNNDYSWKFIINVVNTERMCFTPEYLKSHYNFPYMATIDIFVIDNVYEDEKLEAHRREKIKSVLTVADAISENNFRNSKVDELLTEIETNCDVIIDRTAEFVDIKRQLYKITQDIMSEYDNDNSEYVVQQIPWGVYYGKRNKRDLYEGIIRLPFEDTYICVSKLYDRLLRDKYGNYWEIHMGVGGHGYPYYNAQKEALGLPKDADYIPHYKWDSSLIEVVDNIAIIGGLEQRYQTIDAINQFKKSSDYNGEFDRETVVFLPFKGKYWDSIKPYYEEEKAKENVDVFVVPLPYFYKEYNGVLREEAQYDLESYPEELPIYLIEQLDLESMCPDRIYIQNPYDEFNMCMSVPEEYYSSNIRNLTKKLIYIPWFEMADFSKENYPSYYNMKYYCTVPGVVLSDEVIVNSQVIKDRYIDKLCEFAGDDTRLIWENKISVHSCSKACDTTSEKTLLFYTSPSTILEYGEKYISKLNNCIELFIKNRDKISVIWYFNRESRDIVKKYDEVLYEKIKRAMESASKNDAIAVSDSFIPRQLLDRCCAYYGDPSYFVKDFMLNKKPVMISNIDV